MDSSEGRWTFPSLGLTPRLLFADPAGSLCNCGGRDRRCCLDFRRRAAELKSHLCVGPIIAEIGRLTPHIMERDKLRRRGVQSNWLRCYTPCFGNDTGLPGSASGCCTCWAGISLAAFAAEQRRRTAISDLGWDDKLKLSKQAYASIGVQWSTATVQRHTAYGKPP